MDAVFLKLLNMSIAASWLILAVVIVRLCLKKAPKWIVCLLWALAAVRLVCPLSIESALSMVPSAETFKPHNVQFEAPQVYTGIAAVNNAVNPFLAENFAPDPVSSINPFHALVGIAALVWIVGISLMLLYALVSYVRVFLSVRASVTLEGNIWLSDGAETPFILGVIRPRIYLPSEMDPAAMEPVIAHERAHLSRRDHWWKPLGFLILTVHWFNPLCWLAYVLLCRDIELACDEKVIRGLGLEQKKAYSAALLACSVRSRPIAVCPLAFGEVGVKERVKSVLRYKKPAFWIVAAALAACAVVGVCFATNPVSRPMPENVASAAILITDTGEFQPISGEAAEAVIELLRSYRSTSGSASLDRMTRGGESIVRTARIDCADGSSYTLRYMPNQYYTIGVQLNCENGDTYLLLADYYKGLHTALGHLMTGNPGVKCGLTGEDDYQCILIWFPAGEGPQKGWRMECAFDSPFRDLRNSIWYPGQLDEAGAGGVDALIGMRDNAAPGNNGGGEPPLEDPVIEDSAPSTLSAEQAAIRGAIIGHNQSKDPTGLLCCASFVELQRLCAYPKPGDTVTRVTLYGWALYEEFMPSGARLASVSSSHIPVVLRFDVDEKGAYSLVEYWEPRDGSYYADDIYAKVPEFIREDMLDSQKYILIQKQECYALAASACGLDPHDTVEALLQLITSSPAASSNPGDYIDAHPIEYREMTYYGESTLKYCFSRFEKGGETGLEGHIMARACTDIAEGWGEGFYPDHSFPFTGQDWYESFKNNALRLKEQYPPIGLAENAPASYLLLNMLGEV